jgi:thioredoxin-like negative regulator of GroEL
MKLFSTLLVAAMMALGPVARAELPVGWSTNYSSTLAAAEARQRPVLVYFTASWCGPCKLMTRNTLADEAVSDMIFSNLEHVAVDIDEHSDLATQFGVNAVPTFILLSSSHDEVDRTTGYLPSAEFLQWLTNGVVEVKAAAVRQSQFKQELAGIDQLLASTETNASHLAASKLFELCAARDNTITQAAAVRLKALAARDPAAVLEGLNDSRLATRIQAANALRNILGDSFDADPWSDAAAREKAVRDWRAKLAKASALEKPR